MLGPWVGSYTSGMELLSALVLGLFFSGHSPEEVNRALADVLSDRSIQSAFPDGGEVVKPRVEPPSRSRSSTDWSGLGSIAQAVLWVLLGVAVVLVIVALARRLGGYTKDVRILSPPAAEPVPVASSQLSLEGAEALAAAGRFDEAIHALLLVAFRNLGRETTLAGSLTSREILDEGRLSGEARRGAEDLVGAVELSLFGGRESGQVEYASAMDSYRRFAGAAGWAGA